MTGAESSFCLKRNSFPRLIYLGQTFTMTEEGQIQMHKVETLSKEEIQNLMDSVKHFEGTGL